MPGRHRAPATLTDRIADWVDAAVAVAERALTVQPATVRVHTRIARPDTEQDKR